MGIGVCHNMVTSSVEESHDRIRLDAAVSHVGKVPEHNGCRSSTLDVPHPATQIIDATAHMRQKTGITHLNFQ
jgi:hypothetical protein